MERSSQLFMFLVRLLINGRLSVVRFGGIKSFKHIFDCVGGRGHCPQAPPHVFRRFIIFTSEKKDKRGLEISLRDLPLFPGIKSISQGSQASIDFRRTQFQRSEKPL